MIRKYFSIGFIFLLLTGYLSGQSHYPTLLTGKAYLKSPVQTHLHANQYLSRSAPAQVIWSNDFSNASTWVIDNFTPDSSQNWAIGPNGPANAIATGMTPINSTTATNNFALFDSDGLGSPGGTQDAWIATASPINVSAFPNVKLRFEQYYRKMQGKTYLEVSNDSSTWISFELNTYLGQNSFTANPELQGINISSVAGSQATVWLRFRYSGSWDYAWMIDDVKLIAAPNNDLDLEFAAHGGILTGSGLEYTHIPLRQAFYNPNIFEGVIGNEGVLLQTNTTLNVNVFLNADTVFAGNSAPQSLSSMVKDTFATTSAYQVANTGVYSVIFSARSDSATTSFISKTFAVSDSVYGKDHDDAIAGLWATPGCAYELGHSFQIFKDQEAASVSVYTSGGTNGTDPDAVVYAILYEVDTAGNFMLTGQSGMHTVASNETDNWITLSFLSPLQLDSGKTYIACAGTTGGINKLITGASSGSAIDTAFLHDIDDCFSGGSPDLWYKIAGNPMVRLNLVNICSGFSDSLSVMPANCDTTDGTATVFLSGGSAPYTYLWDAAAGNQTDSTATGLAAGYYGITVTDSLGCPLVSRILVNNINAPAISDSIQDILCFGDCSGTIDLTINGINTPFTFEWNSGDTTQNLSGLCSGNYYVTVSDSLLCKAFGSYSVAQPDSQLSGSFTTQSANNISSNDGQATVSVIGGTTPYSYSWSNGDSVQTATGLSGNTTYHITITDSLGCTVEDSIFIGVLGIESQSVNRQLKVYPNPTTGIINLDLKQFERGEYLIQVSNILGQLVWGEVMVLDGNTGKQLDLSRLKKGLYLLSISGNEGRFLNRIILN